MTLNTIIILVFYKMFGHDTVTDMALRRFKVVLSESFYIALKTTVQITIDALREVVLRVWNFGYVCYSGCMPPVHKSHSILTLLFLLT